MSTDSLYVAAQVSYDGTDYFGFQLQSGQPTIQGALELALSKVTGSFHRIAASGRTDTGVHARGQVISAEISWKHNLASLQRAWNSHLPTAIVIEKIAVVPIDFHPRFSAQYRTYRYFVEWAPKHSQKSLPDYSPLSDRFGLYITHPLDIDAMVEASQFLIGTLDFSTFGHPPQGSNSIRTILQADWQVVKDNLLLLQNYERQRVVFTISATAFLRQMVRKLTGSLIEVGRGRWSPEKFRTILMACDRSMSAPPVPPNGLVLEYVDYPDYPNIFL